MASWQRVLLWTGLAVLAGSRLVAALLRLPGAVSLAVTFSGLVLFLMGSALHWHWAVVVGGVCLFSGVFAASLAGALN
jgi:predicted benzoate:H+ symporter BenE